ncbi:MAG: LptA/OstA family protein [Bacillota bacterium]
MSLQIEAPGGLEYGKDGAISASGLPGRPLVAALAGYEIRAQRLSYDARRRVATFSGEVLLRVPGEKGRGALQAERVILVLGERTAKAEGRVAIEEEGLTIQADAAQADLGEGNYTVLGRPAVARYQEHKFTARSIRYYRSKARLTIEEEVVWEMTGPEGKRTITAARGEYDRAHGLAELTEVVITEKDLRLQAGRLIYEEAEDRFTLTGAPRLDQGEERSLVAASLAWDPRKGLFVASGGVSFRDRLYSGTAQEVRYEPEAKRILLCGEARLGRREDFILGAEILYDLAEERVRVNGGAKARILLEQET